MFIGLIVIYLFAPLALGSNRDWAWMLDGAGCFLLLIMAGILFLFNKIRISPACLSSAGRLSLGFFLLAVLWQWIQTIYIPFDVLSFADLPSKPLYSEAYTIVNHKELSGQWAISVDTGISRKIALRSTYYGCLFILLLMLIDTRKRLLIFCYVLLFSGLFQAVFGSAMVLSGMEYLLGQQKTYYRGFATGTFVNRNHFAGYLEMTLAIGIGLLMVTKERVHASYNTHWRSHLRRGLEVILSEKAVLRLSLVIMVIGLILSRSRMGNAAFFNSLLIISLFSVAASSSFRKLPFYLLVLSILAIDIFLLGSWFGLDKLVARLEQTHLTTEQRVDVDQAITPLLKHYFWVGSGGGTFQYVFPNFLNGPLAGYDHAHNDYLELLSDLGIIGCLPLLGLVILGLWQAIRALRNRQSSLLRGIGFTSVMGIISLLIHSAVDFNLQIPANAMVFIALLALPIIAVSIERKAHA